MRLHLITALLSLLVLCTSASAFAVDRGAYSGRCIDHVMPVAYASLSSQVITVEGKTDAKAAETIASRLPPPAVQHRAPSGPDQSRAPSMCSDPRQPGCQLQAPDAPHQGTMDPMAVDAAMFNRPFEGVGPGVLLAALPLGEPLGVPAESHERPAWRPPAC